MTRDEIAEFYPDLLLLEPADFDAAIIGIAERAGGMTAVAYVRAEVIRVLKRQGMNNEDAEEWFIFNTIGAWMGEHTPVFVDQGA